MKEAFYLNQLLVDPNSNTITTNNKERRVEPKVITLLCFLAENTQRVVSKEEIITYLWQDVIVGDEAVTRLIFNLRNALGDDAKQPIFIETIPKKGYKFLVIPKAIERTKGSVPKLTLGILAFCFTLICVLLFVYSSQQSVINHSIEEVSSITSSGGLERHFSINPETNDVLYVHVTMANSDLFVVSQDQSVPKQLTSSPSRKRAPMWLNQDTFVYIEGEDDNYMLTRQSISGKQVNLYQSPNFLYWAAQLNNKLFFTEESIQGRQTEVHLKSIDLITGSVVNHSVLNESLPRTIKMFTTHSDSGDVFVTDQAGKLYQFNETMQLTRPLKTAFSRVRYLHAIDENSILITGENESASGVWQVNLNDSSQVLIYSASGGQQISQATLHQEDLIYSTYQFDWNVYLKKAQEDAIDIEAINTPYNELYPKYMPDQTGILYLSNKGGGYDLWRYKFEQNTVEQVTQLKVRQIYSPAISSDGRFAAISYQQDSFRLAVVDLKNDKVLWDIETPFQQFPLGWSNDQKHIYVSEYSTQLNLYKRERSLSHQTLIQESAGLFAFEHHQSKHLSFADYALSGIRTMHQTNGEEHLLPIKQMSHFRLNDIIAKNNALYIATRADGEYAVQKLALDSQSYSPAHSLPLGSQLTDIEKKTENALFMSYSSKVPQGDIIRVHFEK